MKRGFILVLLLLTFSLWADDKAVFTAMQKEIHRGMDSLKIEGMNRPYFISLRMQDIKMTTIAAAFGSLYNKNHHRYRSLQSIVRVGTPDLDNTNFQGEHDYGFYMGARVMIPLEDDILALRRAFWLSIDKGYKDALKHLAQKRGYMEKHPQEEYPADFLPSEGKNVVEIPSPEPIETSSFISYVKILSRHLRDYPFLVQGIASINVFEVTQYYLDSEGNRHCRPESYIGINVSMQIFTKEWYPVEDQINVFVRRLEDLPSPAEIEKGVDHCIAYLKGVMDQKPMEEYTGPVLFSEEGSGAFFLNLFGNSVSKPRKSLSAKPRSSVFYFGPLSQRNEGFLVKRLNLRILPHSFTVDDRPLEKSWQDKPLIGTMVVDDEGTTARDVRLVEKGKLIALPMRRTATRKFKESNGHARAMTYAFPEGRVTNLFIEDGDGLSSDAFMETCKSAVADSGSEEVLVITKIKSEIDLTRPESIFAMLRNRKKSLLKDPMEAYLWNLRTGEKIPVFGLAFTDLTEKTLKEISGSTSKRTLHSFMTISRRKNIAPVSVISPDIMVEEMILQKGDVEKVRTPDLPAPPLGKR